VPAQGHAKQFTWHRTATWRGSPSLLCPGAKPGTILLQELAIATCRTALFCSNASSIHRSSPKFPATLSWLAASSTTPPTARPRLPGTTLPATAQERDALKQLAGKRPVLTLGGLEASTARNLAGVAEVRYAHLANTVFFKEEEFLQEKKRWPNN